MIVSSASSFYNSIFDYGTYQSDYSKDPYGCQSIQIVSYNEVFGVQLIEHPYPAHVPAANLNQYSNHSTSDMLPILRGQLHLLESAAQTLGPIIRNVSHHNPVSQSPLLFKHDLFHQSYKILYLDDVSLIAQKKAIWNMASS